MPDFSILETNIIDFIKEEQLKLGFQKESIRIYYFLSSLNHYFNTELDVQEMLELLDRFTTYVKERLGSVDVSVKKDRFCFLIPPEGTEYVHKEVPDDLFLKEFIEVISSHSSGIDDLIDVFHKFSEKIHVEKISNDDFDYLIYFEDGNPNNYRYCVKLEECHMIYHRFSIGDYEDLFS